MSVNTQLVRCSKCNANNRVSLNSPPVGQPVCGRCKTPLAFADSPLTITDANFGSEVEKSPLPVLLDFWAAWCGPCRMVAPVIEQLAKELNGKVRVGKIDVDANQRTAGRFRVQSIPTLLILKDGMEIDRIVGAASKEAIVRRLQPFILE